MLNQASSYVQKSANAVFQKMFSSIFVYNILYEDSEQDEKYFGIDENSQLLAISGAGCGAAAHVAARPRRMDLVDMNYHHLALTALKIQSMSRSSSYDQFYEMFGRGYCERSQSTIGQLLKDSPAWIQDYWVRNHGYFKKNFYAEGMTAKLSQYLRKTAGLEKQWLHDIGSLPTEDRKQRVLNDLNPALQKRFKLLSKTVLSNVGLGINKTQKSRLEEQFESTDFLDIVLAHIEKLAETDIARNWFVWHGLFGEFNHELEDSLPPWVRRDRFENAQDYDGSTHFHRRNLFQVLESAGSQTWTHYSLLDMPDWLSEAEQANLAKEILRTSRDGAMVLYRSVTEDNWLSRYEQGKRFHYQEEDSAAASEGDRSCLYSHVRFYRVHH